MPTTTVLLDKIETLSAKEKYGNVIHVERTAYISGLSGTDWSVLYDVLEDAGIPVAGARCFR